MSYYYWQRYGNTPLQLWRVNLLGACAQLRVNPQKQKIDEVCYNPPRERYRERDRVQRPVYIQAVQYMHGDVCILYRKYVAGIGICLKTRLKLPFVQSVTVCDLHTIVCFVCLFFMHFFSRIQQCWTWTAMNTGWNFEINPFF